MKIVFVKENKIPTGAVWNMVQTEENLARYFAQFETDNPPTTEAEALERAGATFFLHCIYFYDISWSKTYSNESKGINAKSLGIGETDYGD